MGSMRRTRKRKLRSDEDTRICREQTYDSTLAAMLVKLEKFIIPLVNEVFGENFTQEAEVKIRDSKNIVQKEETADFTAILSVSICE